MARFGGSRRMKRVGGFPGSTSDENSPTNVGDLRDMGSIFGLGRFPGEGNGNPLQSSCLENAMKQSMGSQELDMTE